MPSPTTLNRKLDIAAIRSDFPILSTEANGRPLAYLDNAATSQKPRQMLDALDAYWTQANANVHRGVHYLSQKATVQFDAARVTVQSFLGAEDAAEIIFTKGCTEGINLVADCLGRGPLDAGTELAQQLRLQAGDVILLSAMEHHSNIVPWQMAAERTGAKIKVIPITDSGEIVLDDYERLLRDNRVKIVGVVHVSNSLGTVNPVAEMAKMAHEAGAMILIDGAQAGPHKRINVQEIDADFYTLSCHKIYAPTGVGVLYGKRRLLEAMPPYHGGGDMIRTVSFEKTTYAGLPNKYEAGTPNMAGVIGLGAAINYLESIRRESAEAWEDELTGYATAQMSEIAGVRLVGVAKRKASIVSFVMDSAHPHDIGTVLDQEGIAIRAGHHCCMPLMQRLGVPATARASFAFYNTKEEVDRLVEGVKRVKEMFG